MPAKLRFQYHRSGDKNSTTKGVSVMFFNEEDGTFDSVFELTLEDAIAAYEFLKPLVAQLYIDAFGPDYFTKLFSDLRSKEPENILQARKSGGEIIFPNHDGWYATRLASCTYGPTASQMAADTQRYMLENRETGISVKMSRTDALRLTQQLTYMLYDDQETNR